VFEPPPTLNEMLRLKENLWKEQYLANFDACTAEFKLNNANVKLSPGVRYYERVE